MNTQERLEEKLDSVLNRADNSKSGITGFIWFQLAVVAVRCLIVIASALWDKEP